MNIITYIKKIPVMKKVFAVGTVILGVAAILTGDIFLGIIFVGIGIGLSST